MSIDNESLILFNCEENTVKAQNEVFGPIVRNKYLVECCTDGFGYIIINGHEFRIEEGDCYVLLPGDKVSHVTTEKTSRSELSCLIQGTELKHAIEAAGINSSSPFAPASAYDDICAAIRRMIAINNDRSIGADYLRTAEIYKIMSALVKEKSSSISTSAVFRAVGIMDESYDLPLTVDRIAKQVGLERSYFSVLFHEHTGMTPHAYLNSVRVKRACTLMNATHLSMAEIALRVGLDPSCFSRMFKRETGISPKQYRDRKK